MAYELPKLDYAYDALKPHIDARTMEIHHTKHHQAYVTKLNAALADGGYKAPECVADLISNLAAVPEKVRTAVRNNGGGHANHSFFWKIIGPKAGGEPKGDIARAIAAQFGSFESFKTQFSNAAIGHFNNGWAWLHLDKEKKMCVCAAPNHDSPLMAKEVPCPGKPLLVLDIWEHAYYLKYQNRRPEYVAAFWNVVNWAKVDEIYRQAQK